MADNREFLNTIADFIDDAPKDIDAVMKQSVQDVLAEAQKTTAQGGRMPVDTGNLRNSLVFFSEGGEVFAETDTDSAREQAKTREGGAYVLGIAGAKPFVKMTAGWTAPYAEAVEFGTSRTNGNGAGFARMAVANWNNIVIKNAERLFNG